MNEDDCTGAEGLDGNVRHCRQPAFVPGDRLGEGATEAANEDASALLPEWCDIYAGLTDEEVERLERAISRRLDLTRRTSVPESGVVLRRLEDD